MKQKLFTLLTLLLVGISSAWAEDFTIVPSFSQNYTKLSYGLVDITLDGSGNKISSSAINAGSKGANAEFTISTTKSDIYLKTITFSNISNATLSIKEGSAGSYDSETSTFTAATNQTTVSFLLTNTKSGSTSSVKVPSIVVDGGTNEIETLSLSSVTDGTISKTAKIGGITVTSAVTLTTTGASVSEGILSWTNNKNITFTSDNDIKYVAFLTTDDKIISSNSLKIGDTKLTTASWTGSQKTITFTNATGAARTISKIFVITAPAAPTHSIILHDNNGAASNGSATATEGINKLSSITPPTWSGHSVEGYYKEAGCTNKIADASGNLQASTDYTNASSQWTSTSDEITLYAKWLTTITPSLSYDNTTLVLTALTTANPTLTGNTGGGAVTYSSSATGVATVDPSTGIVTAVAGGTARITANISANGDYAAGSAYVDIKVVAAPEGLIDQKLATGSVTWDASVIVTEDYTNISGLTALSQHGTSTASGNGKTGMTSKVATASGEYNENNYLELSFTIADGKQLNLSSVSIPVQPVTSSTNNFKAVLSDNKGSLEIIGTKTNQTQGTLAAIPFASYGSLKGTVTLRIYAWGWGDGYRLGTNIVIDGTITDIPAEPSDPVAEGSTVTLTTTANMDGWRSYNNNTVKKYTVSANTKVYYASATGENKVTLAEIDGGVPANTAVILHKTDAAGAAANIVLTETDAAIPAIVENELKVSTAGQNLGKVYRLGYKAGTGVGFYTYTTTSAPEGIIYVSSVSSANFLGLDFEDGEATGVATVGKAQTTTNREFYNLAGQRVAQPTKGLYIVNGKKVVIR